MLSPVVIYENASEEPLLEQPTEDKNMKRQLTRFRSSSLALGLIVGFFIQLFTLGSNYLIISMRGEDVMQTSQQDIILLLWSFFTSTMAIVILVFLRNLVCVACEVDAYDEMIIQLECRFIVGALIGVFSAWAATDVALGMSAQIVYSFATLVVALTWCRIMMWWFSPPAARGTNETPDDVMIV